MASDTFLTICQAIASETDEDSISTIESATLDRIKNIIRWVNEGYEKAFNKAYKNELAETSGTFSASAATYDFSSVSIKYFKSLYVTGFRPIDIIDHDVLLRDYVNDSTICGQPYKAAYHQRKLYFYPIPDQAYTINYTAKVSFTKLSTNTQTPIVDSNILINYGKYKQFSRDGNTLGAQIAKADYEDCLKDWMDSLKNHSKVSRNIRYEDEVYLDAIVTLDQDVE